MTEELLLEVAAGIAVITLNRPEAMNTFNQPMIEGLGEAYRRCDQDDDIRAVVVTGSGKALARTGRIFSKAQSSTCVKWGAPG